MIPCWPVCRRAGDASSQQVRGWRRPSWWSSQRSVTDPVDDIAVHVPGVYVIYSKVAFNCGSDLHHVDSGGGGGRRTVSHSHIHKIFAVDGKSGKSVPFAFFLGSAIMLQLRRFDLSRNLLSDKSKISTTPKSLNSAFRRPWDAKTSIRDRADIGSDKRVLMIKGGQK